MTTLAIGTSVTLNVGSDSSCKIFTNGGLASISVTPTGGVTTISGIGPLPVRQTFGPFATGATLVISNQTASLDYSVPGFDPTNVAITGGTVPSALISPANKVRDTIVFAGDSITNGSASTNAGVTSFRSLFPILAGSGSIAASVNAGTSGFTSTALLASLTNFMPAGTILSVMIGTNDAGSAVPIATYMANILAIVALAQKSAMRVNLCTVPPRGSGAGAAAQKSIDQYNIFLRWYAPTIGTLSETHASLVDPLTGYLAAAYDVDGTHPNDAGHRQLANAIVAATASVVRPPINKMVDSLSQGYGLFPDPMNTATTGWNTLLSFQPAVVASVQPAVSNDLTVGSWFQLAISAAANTANTTIGKTLNAGWSVGDQLLVVCKIKDSTGNALVGIAMRDQNNLTVANLGNTASIVGASTNIATIFTVPAGTTSLVLSTTFGWITNDTKSISIGNEQVFNLTQMGLVGIVS